MTFASQATWMREAFGAALLELGQDEPHLVVVDADVMHPTRAHRFQERYPDRFVQMGVAEQNAVGFAAGLATMGYIPLVNLFAVFASKRACDQVSISVAYPRLNVKITGCYAGLTTPGTGATHQSVQDIAIMRAMPHMVVVEPADPLELRLALRAAVSYTGPVYFRVVRCSLPHIFDPDYQFSLGRGVVLRDGTDVTLIGSGLMTSRCLEAASLLGRAGISAQVISISTLKPLDVELIVSAASETGAVVTAENHSVIGGLGSAVAEVLATQCPVPMAMVGIHDTFGESGKLEDLLEKYGLTGAAVAAAAQNLLAGRGIGNATGSNPACVQSTGDFYECVNHE